MTTVVGSFRETLGGAGRALLRTILPALLVLGFGLLNATDLGNAKLQGTVFVVALSVAVFRLIQGLVPAISVSHYVAAAYAKYVDAALQAFVGTFASLAIGYLSAPEFHVSAAVVTGLLVAAGNAALRVVQSMVSGAAPDPGFADHTPPEPVEA